MTQPVQTTDNASNGTTTKKPVRRTFTERLSDLSLEEKVAVIKELKGQVAEELNKREAAATIAKDLAQGL